MKAVARLMVARLVALVALAYARGGATMFTLGERARPRSAIPRGDLINRQNPMIPMTREEAK